MGKLVLPLNIFMFIALISKFFIIIKGLTLAFIHRCVHVMRNLISTISPIRRRDFRIGKRGWDYEGVRFSIKSHLPDKGNNVQDKLLYTDMIKM